MWQLGSNIIHFSSFCFYFILKAWCSSRLMTTFCWSSPSVLSTFNVKCLPTAYESTSLCWCIFLRYSLQIKIFVTFHFYCTKIDEQDAKTKLFARLLSCLQLRHLGSLGHQNMHSAVSFVSQYGLTSHKYPHNQPPA